MDNWREYLNGADVRSTPLRDQLYNDTMPLQTDWTKFPGMPSLWYGEHWVLNNTYTLIHTTNRYWHWSIYISIGYVITIFALQSAMAKLNVKLELKRQLIAWNLFLAIFSFLGTIRCWPEFIHVITTRGFTASYTEADYALVSPIVQPDCTLFDHSSATSSKWVAMGKQSWFTFGACDDTPISGHELHNHQAMNFGELNWRVQLCLFVCSSQFVSTLHSGTMCLEAS